MQIKSTFVQFFCFTAVIRVCLVFVVVFWGYGELLNFMLKQDLKFTLTSSLKTMLSTLVCLCPDFSAGLTCWHWQEASRAFRVVVSLCHVSCFHAWKGARGLWSLLEAGGLSPQCCAHMASGHRREGCSARGAPPPLRRENSDMKIRCWWQVSGLITVVWEQTTCSSFWNLEAEASQAISCCCLLYVPAVRCIQWQWQWMFWQGVWFVVTCTTLQRHDKSTGPGVMTTKRASVNWLFFKLTIEW